MNKHLTIIVFFCCLFLGGCATTLPTGYERTHSTALDEPEKTELGQFFHEELGAHPGDSGAVMIDSGEWGFRARAGLANMAMKTLDVQYYIWEVDTSGIILAERLMRAADRGVRVRMLIDHVTTKNTDFKFARMNHHPNIEIRVFNPFANRSFRTLEFLLGLSRLNHRMHNKAFIIDNAMAIVGGRNIGNNYFGVHTAANFRDLDLAVVGPIVQDISSSFDEYWNSEWSVPIEVIIDDEFTEAEYQEKKAALYRMVETEKDYPYPIDTTAEQVKQRMETFRDKFVWAPAQALYDAPDKIETGEEEVANELRRANSTKEREVLLEIAYLIPGPRELEAVKSNNEKGIRQRILTNSLATNDVAAAHAGYARYRKQLLRNGVELYELRPDADSEKRRWSALAGRSKASLHTKAFVVDREVVGVGSFNLDPRSIAINTEIAILVESPELAQQLVEYMDTGVDPRNSYRVILEPDEESSGERLVWITEVDGKEVRYYEDPEAGFWRRFGAWMMSLLPIEKHL